MDQGEQKITDVKVDKDNLYREEIFTDFHVAAFRKLTPIKIDGSDDPSRKVLFVAQTQLMSPQGPVPIHCPIEAETLSEAVEKFPAAVDNAVREMIEEAKALEREEASRIVIPK
ncbi:MAG: hypothetical protein PHY31_03755 [Smithellaceae bacterium]|nr:hypothetical protein [Smithellaceae bacterium]